MFQITVPADHLRRVYAEHGRAMHLYAARLLDDTAAAEDLVQEALIRLWHRPQVLDDDRGSLRGWLLTVVRNLAVDRVRGQRARPPEVADTAGREPAQPDHADAVVASITVHRALGALSAEHRAVLEQVFLADNDLDGAARVLDVPKGTVKSRSFYALRALRGMLDHDRPSRTPAR